VAVAIAGCGRARESQLFDLLPPGRTGVTFANRLPDDSRSTFSTTCISTTAARGGGDVNNDGLPDLYFTSNVGPNRLYVNKGDYRFEDVTDRAGVADSDGWKTGVPWPTSTGRLRRHLRLRRRLSHDARAQRPLHQQRDGTFTDRTKEYGLDFDGFSTQALFFDYDGDGDLDMYLLTHAAHPERASAMHGSRDPRRPGTRDRLYRNDGATLWT